MIELQMEVLGLDSFAEFIAELAGLPSHYSGVSLAPIPRAESKSDNSKIMNYLAESGRDFKAMRGSQVEQMEVASANELQRRLDVQTKKMARALGKKHGMKGRELTAFAASMQGMMNFKGDDKWGRQAQGAMLKAAMEKYMEMVTDNIEEQRAMGGVVPLTEDYADYKRKTYGFETPIGKATGQLLENLDTSISAKNIKLEK